MARVVTGIGSSHGPQLKVPPSHWHERGNADRGATKLEFRGATYDFDALRALRGDFSAECQPEVMGRRFEASQAALDHLGSHIDKADVDVLVIVSSDHKEIFDDELLSPFAIYWGDTVEHLPFTTEQIDAMAPGLGRAAVHDVPDHPITRACHPALARYLIKATGTDGFDVSASQRLPAGMYGNSGIPHGWGYLYQRIFGEDSTIPFVPLFVNTFFEPNQPLPRRCYELGRSIGRALNAFPDDLRIGVVASGGLSHFVIDEDLDARFLDALRSGDAEALTSFDPDVLRSGSSELRSWITVAGIAAETGLTVSNVEYQPCYRTEAGTGNAMGFVTWEAEAQPQ